MTFGTFKSQLLQCQTPEECDAFLKKQLHEIRPLFYGLTQKELRECRFHFSDLFHQFSNTTLSKHTRAEGLPPSVLSLLILFISLFERAGLYSELAAITEILPSNSSIRWRTEAIFKYKYITDASCDYTTRFDDIMRLLQQAWQNEAAPIRTQCEDLIIEYYTEAILESWKAGIDIRKALQARYLDPNTIRTYPFLPYRRLAGILSLGDESLLRERMATRSRIVESLHAEACSLVPEILLFQAPEEHLAEGTPDVQEFKTLPDFLENTLTRLGAHYNPQHQVVRIGLDADDIRNRNYLGTYFPRSVLEAQNILSELFTIPPVADAFTQKDNIRILDIGSGTGGSLTGAILAVVDSIGTTVPIEVTSLDGNADALNKQQEVLNAVREHIPCPLIFTFVQNKFPTAIDGFVEEFQAFARTEGPKYDIILFWKHLSEYYNANFAQANGIVKHALQIASTLLTPNGICCVLDVTTIDNGVEYFAMTINRESNEYATSADATMATILPLPCARHAQSCRLTKCFTQRIFIINHRQHLNDSSKVSYRVFAPRSFAAPIIATYTDQVDYRVNAQRPQEACAAGIIKKASQDSPSGFTEFFIGRRNK